MHSILFALAMPMLVLMVVAFLIVRLRLFSSLELGGRYPFLFGGILVFVVTLWQAIEVLPEYHDWFIQAAYPAIELAKFFVLVLGVLLIVIGIALYADFWQMRREEIQLREGKLSIIDNLQHELRKPYHLVEVLSLSLREVLARFPSAAGAVFLVNRSRRQFVLTSSSGLTKEEIARLEYYPLENNLVSQAVELGDPILTSRFDFFDIDGKAVRSRFTSCLILPLTSGMEKIGGLILFSEEGEYFARADIKSLIPVSQWLAERVKSARLARELSQANTAVESGIIDYSDMMTRFASASRAVMAADAVQMFCRSLVSLAGNDSVHLFGLKQGSLVFYGGSEPLLDLTENYKTALVDAIGRTKPLVINQEASDENGRRIVTGSSLIFPLSSEGGNDALLFRREGKSFSVGDRELKQMDNFALLSSILLRYDQHRKLDLTRRRGFSAILRLLQTDRHPGPFESAPGYFLRSLEEILPGESVTLSFTVGEHSTLQLRAATGNGEQLLDQGMAVVSGEGCVGQVAVNGEGLFIFGRGNVARHIESYDEQNRSILLRMFGERGFPAFLACCPIRTGQTVVGVVMVTIPDLMEGERGEWERLLTLAAGLYSLRLTMDDLQSRQADSYPAGKHTWSASVVNQLNNHFSAVVGTAELATHNPDLPGPLREQLRRIVDEAEQAAGLLRRGVGSSDTKVSPVNDDLNNTIRSVLDQGHVSGGLYMFGGHPREMRMELNSIEKINFTSESLRILFEAVLNRFASMAEDDDIITITTYVDDTYVYVDLSRHRRNFPPVERVAGFGTYQLAESALLSRPSDVFLTQLADTPSYYAFDQAGSVPAYLSFKFSITGSSKTETSLKPGRAIKLLAVDDQAVILDLISAMGQSLGYQVYAVRTAEQGLRLAETQRFDVVLADFAMPTMSGLELARRFHRLHPNTPIILVTGWETKLDKVQLDEAGIIDVLYKPFRIEQLTDIVQMAVIRSWQQ